MTEEILDAVVDVHLFDQELQQTRRPGQRVRCLNCRTQGSRPHIAAPPLDRPRRRRDRARADSFRRRLRGRDTSSIAIAARWHGDPLEKAAGESIHFMASAISESTPMPRFPAFFGGTCGRWPRDRGMRYPERNQSGSGDSLRAIPGDNVRAPLRNLRLTRGRMRQLSFDVGLHSCPSNALAPKAIRPQRIGVGHHLDSHAR